MAARRVFAALAFLSASIVYGEEEGQQKAISHGVGQQKAISHGVGQQKAISHGVGQQKAISHGVGQQKASSHGVAASFPDFHQYMQQYGRKGDAGDFQKYLKFMEFTTSSKASSFGQDYEDFSKYLQLHGDALVSSQEYMDFKGYMQNHAQFSDFQKYLTNQGQQAPNYGQYLDLQKYTGGQQASAAPDYRKFLKVEKDVSGTKAGEHAAAAAAAPKASTVLLAEKDDSTADTETSGGAQGTAGQDYQKYMDYSKYTGSSSASSDGAQTSSYSQFMDYSKYVPGDYMKYSDYSKYMKGGQGGVDFASMQGQAQVPYSATDCKSPEELEAWHKKQLDTVHSWIPAQFQGHALSNIEQDYKTNKERLAGQADAASLEPQPALQQASVPKESSDPVVEKALADAKAALAKTVVDEPAAKAPQALLQTPPLAVELPASPSSNSEEEKRAPASRALLVVLVGLALPAFLALFGVGRSRLQAKQEEQQPELDRYVSLHGEDEEQALL